MTIFDLIQSCELTRELHDEIMSNYCDIRHEILSYPGNVIACFDDNNCCDDIFVVCYDNDNYYKISDMFEMCPISRDEYMHYAYVYMMNDIFIANVMKHFHNVDQ